MSDDPVVNDLVRRVREGALAKLNGGHVSGGANRMSADEFEARRDAALLDAFVPLAHPHRDAAQFRGETTVRHMAAQLRARGVTVPATDAGVLDRWTTLQREAGAAGTTDLPDIVANQATVAALAGWSKAPVSWPLWCRSGTMNSYRQESRVAPSAFPALEKVIEHAEIPLAARSGRRELITGSKFAKIYRITRELLLGDSAGTWARELFEAGRAAKAAVERETTNLLTSQSGTGPTLNQDNLALFHATHGNYVAAGGGAPSVTTVSAAVKAMRTRTDPVSGEVLNIVPRILLVPAALEPTARVLTASMWNTTLGDSEGDLIVAVNPRLDAVSATAWYLTADPAAFDTFEIGFIGRPEPLVEKMAHWTSDGVDLRVMLSFGVAALDFRTMYRNIGA